MKKSFFTFNSLAILLVATFFVASCASPSDDMGGTTDTQQVNPKEIISKMTLEQKAQLVVGTGMFIPLPDSILASLPPGFGEKLDTSTVYGKMVNQVRSYLPGAAGFSAEFPELGITSQSLSDGPAGLRIMPIREGDDQTYYATAFPIATLLASTWDTELIEEVGEAMGQEVLKYGADVILGPGMNLQRDPLCGRNFEYYSEDPLVTGKMAAAMVSGIQSNGVGTSVKHFAVNNQETNRMSVNTIVSERAIRELYLKGFEIAIKEAKPWTVMSSYNKLNGPYTSENPDILENILREEWGFEGYVMTDWGGGTDPVAQMKAGNDMIQPGSSDHRKKIIAAVNSGELDEAILDRNIERILKIMLKTPRFKNYEYAQPDLEGHAQVTRQVAAEGMVLLENNDNALPFTEGIKTVAAFGNSSYDFISGGTGSGDVNEAYTISLIQGLQNANYTIDEELQSVYEKYMSTAQAVVTDGASALAAALGGKIPVKEMKLDPALAVAKSKTADIALITIGRNAGEGGDRKAVPGDFYLTDDEKSLIKTVSDAFQSQGKKAVVVLNIAGVVETASWKNIPDAVLLSWQPGQEAGNSVVDVLSGKVNPSGKLTASFPNTYEDTPTFENFPGYPVKGEVEAAEDQSGFSFMQRIPWEVVYEEDIYVGYRYYNTFDVPVSYEFGYGKSYSSFEYGNVSLSSESFDGSLTVSVDVTNTGSIPGKEIVQVYVSAPQVILEKPESELAAFGKTGLLAPGATETLTFTIDASTLSSFNSDNSSWIVEAGDYEVKVGASCLDIRGTAGFNVADEILVEKTTLSLIPEKEIDILTQ
jgi:beta-glucosidase